MINLKYPFAAGDAAQLHADLAAAGLPVTGVTVRRGNSSSETIIHMSDGATPADKSAVDARVSAAPRLLGPPQRQGGAVAESVVTEDRVV